MYNINTKEKKMYKDGITKFTVNQLIGRASSLS